MAVAIPIIIILIVAVATVLVLARNRARGGTGSLSRATRRRDKSTVAEELPTVSTSTELESTGRERADDTRATYESVPARRRGDITQWEPVDEEELGVNRRQFMNRGLGALVGFSLAGF